VTLTKKKQPTGERFKTLNRKEVAVSADKESIGKRARRLKGDATPNNLGKKIFDSGDPQDRRHRNGLRLRKKEDQHSPL